MSDAEATRAARMLNRARWGSTVAERALNTLRERHGELDEAQRAELRELAGEPLVDISEAQRAGLRRIADPE
jgi:hypothetical protein